MFAIDFIDRSFNKEASGEYPLSVQANQNGLAYCVFDEKARRYLIFREHRFEDVHLTEDLIKNIGSVLESDEILSLPFRSVRFLGYTQQSALIPAVYFDKRKMQDYLSYNQGEETDHEVYSNSISPMRVINVFAIHRELVSLISVSFSKVVFVNQTTPFLMNLAIDKEAWSNPGVYVGLNPEFFDLAAVGDDELKLYNTFQYVNETDILYYILFVYKQLAFDAEKVPLYISGEHSSRLSYYEILKQYIPETGYAKVDGVSSLVPGIYRLNTLKFLNLLNLQNCELSAEHTEAEK